MTYQEYLAIINQEPTQVKKADDGDYEFQPISHIKNELDIVFAGEWSFDLDRETIGKGEAIAKGHLTVRHPATGNWITRSGTAAIVLGNGLRLDFPKLESAVLSNAAKKIGKRFGRDLNKDKEDVPVVVAVVQEEDREITKQLEATISLLNVVAFREDAEVIIKNSGFSKLHPTLNEILLKKPTKIK